MKLKPITHTPNRKFTKLRGARKTKKMFRSIDADYWVRVSRQYYEEHPTKYAGVLK